MRYVLKQSSITLKLLSYLKMVNHLTHHFGLNGPILHRIQSFPLYFERKRELSLCLPSSHIIDNDVQNAILCRTSIIISTFSWHRVAPHVVAIQLIYRYHMIN